MKMKVNEKEKRYMKIIDRLGERSADTGCEKEGNRERG